MRAQAIIHGSDGRLCTVCRIVMPHRSKHCRFCDKYVSTYARAKAHLAVASCSPGVPGVFIGSTITARGTLCPERCNQQWHRRVGLNGLLVCRVGNCVGEETYFAYIVFIATAVVAVFVWIVLLMLYVLHEMQLANSGVGYLLGTSPVVGVKPITVVASLVLWRCRQRSVVILDVSANVDGSVWGTVACSPRQAHQS